MEHKVHVSAHPCVIIIFYLLNNLRGNQLFRYNSPVSYRQSTLQLFANIRFVEKNHHAEAKIAQIFTDSLSKSAISS